MSRQVLRTLLLVSGTRDVPSIDTENSGTVRVEDEALPLLVGWTDEF